MFFVCSALYWTERDSETSPSLKVADLEKKSVRTIKQSQDNTYYQVIVH